MKTESFKILHIFKPTEKLVGGNHTMNTTCSLQLVRATCQLMFAIAVLCVLTRTCTHMYVRFVHADPGEALRRRGRRGPRKAAAVRQVTEFVRTRPCQARPGLWPEDVAVLQAACQALRSCAGGGRVDAAPGPSRRGTAPSMPVRTAARPGRPRGSAWASGGAAPRPDAQEPVSDPTQVSSSTRAPQRSRQGRRAGQPGGGGRHVALRRVCRQASRPQHRSRPQTAPRGRPSPHRSGTVSAPSSLSLVSRLGPCHGPHPAPGHRPFLSPA